MTLPLWSLLAFALWTASLVFVVGAHRVLSVLFGKAKPNAWPTHRQHDGPEHYLRAMRAHANCVENLPVFGALVLIAHVTGIGSASFDVACLVFLAARAGQTVTHIASGRSLAVNVRFGFFTVQLACYGVFAATLIAA